jgi:formylglycine-generating enzyme required for sulfatase activity
MLHWVDDPRAALRVIRGGSWYDDARNCRSAARGFYEPRISADDLGFRLARSLGP